MANIWTIARNTFTEGIRAKTLYALGAYGLLLAFSVTALVPLALGEHARLLRDFGLSGIEFLSVSLVIVVGTTLVYKEMEKRTIYVIIARPVKRLHFLMGKYLGMEMLVGLLIALMAGMFFAGTLLQNGEVAWVLFLPIGMIFLKVSLINAIALFFSSLSSPFLGAVFTFCIYLAGTLSGDIMNLAQRIPSQTVKILLRVIYYLLPNLNNMDLKNQIIFDQAIVYPQVWWAVAYSGVYIMTVMMLTSWTFENKDLK
jgi:ABC-type transport system involved in multi-copper enzyme maturation permease subunit